MYADAVDALSQQARAKLEGQRLSLVSHLVRSMLAGMYVGASIVLIFTIGGSMAKDSPGLVKLTMGVCFGGALTIVIFAGSELFTGSNLVLPLGVLKGTASVRDLAANWVWTWIGNLLGAALLAVLVVRSGVISAEPVSSFILKVAGTKMTLPAEQLILRAVLANWLVCLGVWMNARIKSESARILMIWWCMFTFITCGYEHSVANMCGLLLALLLPHAGAAQITWHGYAYNLALATFGNILGGGLLVAGMYWLGSRTPSAARPALMASHPSPASVSAAELEMAPA